jgi:hypothetical protein
MKAFQARAVAARQAGLGESLVVRRAS